MGGPTCPSSLQSCSFPLPGWHVRALAVGVLAGDGKSQGHDGMSVRWTGGGWIEDGHNILSKITLLEEAVAGKALCIVTYNCRCLVLLASSMCYIVS